MQLSQNVVAAGQENEAYMCVCEAGQVPVTEYRAHPAEAVDHRDLDVVGTVLELLAERAGGGGMALADIGREDQHATPTIDLRRLAGVLAAEAQEDVWRVARRLPAREFRHCRASQL